MRDRGGATCLRSFANSVLTAFRPVVFTIIAALAAQKASEADVPAFESLPGAPHTIFLDFDGHTEPAWECFGESYIFFPVAVVQPALLPDPRIHEIYLRVAEDFAPFNVNVTTIEPQVLTAGHDPTGRAVRIAIGEVTVGGMSFDGRERGWAPNVCDAASTVYVDSKVPNFALAYPRGEPWQIADTVSHEAGHVFGLNHYVPSGAEQRRWQAFGRSPIMSYARQFQVTWHAGVDEFGEAQDDVAELTALLGLRPDDRPDAPQFRIELQMAPLGGSPNRAYWRQRLVGAGIIEKSDDIDFFAFRVVDEGRVRILLLTGIEPNVSSRATDSGLAPNLRGTLELWAMSGSPTAGRISSLGTNSVLAALAPGTFAPVPLPSNEFFDSAQPNLQTGRIYLVAVKGSGEAGSLGHYAVVVDGPVGDLSGPKVVGNQLVCAGSEVTGVRVTFDQPIDPNTTSHNEAWPAGRCECSGVSLPLATPVGTQSCDDPPRFWHARLQTPTAEIDVSDIAQTDTSDKTPTEFLVSFPKQKDVGSYRLRVGPDIRAFGYRVSPLAALCGYPMNQDGRFPNGQADHDQYAYSFAIKAGANPCGSGLPVP